MAVKLKSVKRSDGWWITGLPDGEECGSYPTKDEAEEDRRGLERFYENSDSPRYFTVERNK